MGLIYKHTFKTTNKSYIGLTSKTIEERLNEHISVAKRHNDNLKFYNAIRKYGADDIISEVLEDGIYKNNLTDREKFFIEKFDTLHNGYNSTSGGDGLQGGVLVVIDTKTNLKSVVTVEEWKTSDNLVAESKGKKRKKKLCNHCLKEVYPSEEMYHFDFCKSNNNRIIRSCNCQYCNKNFDDYTGKGNHEIMCSKNPNKKIVNCKFCNKEYGDDRNKLRHEKTCSKNPDKEKYNCKFCNKEYKNNSANTKHENICLSNPNRKILEYFCQYCNKQFNNTKVNLIKHEKYYCKHKKD